MYAVHRTRGQWVGTEGDGKVAVSTEFQVKLAFASIIKQAEDDMAHYRGKGIVRNGKVVPEAMRGKRVQNEVVDRLEVSETITFLKDKAQRFCHALEIPHRVDLRRLGLV